MKAADAVALTRTLVRFDTINPPGRERECARHLGALLEQAGFAVEYSEFGDGRTSLVAKLGAAGGNGGKAPLCLTGHIDVVSLGTRKWSKAPFDGETDGDRLFGRGTSDMKSGVAAMVLAAIALAPKIKSSPGIVLVITAGEEGGCVGSKHLAQTKILGKAGAMVVGEPTSNYPLVGHKGSIKFHARFRGVSAHGSMPELGDNAVYKAADAIRKLQGFDFEAKPHAVMGKPTLNVGTVEGGSGINLVPDSASVGVDIRTVPGVDHSGTIKRIESLLGKEAELDVFSNLPPVWTAPDTEWIQRVFEICKPYVGEAPTAKAATYMTDAANLLKAYAGAPTVVLGPGEAAQAHQTDEWCSQERVRQSVEIYERIIRDWCGI